METEILLKAIGISVSFILCGAVFIYVAYISEKQAEKYSKERDYSSVYDANFASAFYGMFGWFFLCGGIIFFIKYVI